MTKGNYRFIITGAPGTGKTSLVRHLSSLGFSTFGENARLILEKGGKQAPIHSSKPEPGFYKAIIEARLNQYQMAPEGKISFYDRGIPDSLAFFSFMGIQPPDSLLRAIEHNRYNNHVFILPPWKEIFVEDSIRKESFSESAKLHLLLVKAYESLKYELIEVPKLELCERADYVLLKISENTTAL